MRPEANTVQPEVPGQPHPSRKPGTSRHPLKVCVLANGCCENRIDAAATERLCRDAGLAVTADFRHADIIFFNGCGATLSSQENSIRIVSFLGRKKKPSAELAVCGCLTRISEARLREVHGGPVVQREDSETLAGILGVPAPAAPLSANHPLPVLLRSSPRRLVGLESLISIPKLLTRFYPWRSSTKDTRGGTGGSR